MTTKMHYKLFDWNDIHKLNWDRLSRNPNAISLLERNKEKINWGSLSRNPSIFTYDYEKMEITRRPIRDALIQKRFHPRNMDKFDSWGFPFFNDE